MAIAVTMMAKDRAGPKIGHQLMFYPVTADVSDNASYRAFGDGPFLIRPAVNYFLAANHPADRRKDVLAFPLRASLDQQGKHARVTADASVSAMGGIGPCADKGSGSR